jgi:hypothetical protein
MVSLLAQSNKIKRACDLVIDIPDELKNQHAVLIDYYRAFISAFDQLYSKYISARVTGSGLFTMESRAEAQVNDLQTMASYLPDALQKMAVAMPFSVSAIAAVMASAWVYQRDTLVLNSLNAFANLMQPHILEHNLIGKRLATQICLQRATDLLDLALQPNPSSRFPKIAAGINKIRDFAAKHHLSETDYWQSPMALKALEDLNALQKGVLTTSVKDTNRYEMLRTASTADKTDFLLQLLELNPANIQLPDERKPAAVSTDIPDHDAGGTLGVDIQAHERLEREVDRLIGLVQNLVQQRPNTSNTEITHVTVERGRQLQQMAIALRAESESNELFGDCARTMTIQQAIDEIFTNLQRLIANEQRTAELERQVQETRDLVNRLQALHDNPPNRADVSSRKPHWFGEGRRAGL